MYIALEGIDGCGKTTQASLLHNRLRSMGINSMLSREPNPDNPIGQLARALQGAEWGGSPAKKVAALLYTADRMWDEKHREEHLAKENSAIVQSRSILSTFVYQRAQWGRKYLRRISKGVDLLPQLILVLQLPVDISLSRCRQLDLYENRHTLNTVDKEYRLLSRNRIFSMNGSTSCIEEIDATGTKEEVADRIWAVVSRFFLLHRRPVEK